MPVRALSLVAALCAAFALSACTGRKPPDPDFDPWEPMNRKIFWFNDQADDYVLVPVAKGWNYVVPDRAQRCLSNFFNNLRFPIVFVNNLLQWQPRRALEELARLEANTLIGVGGLFDVADAFGVPPQDEDTGQTFGVWGIGPGPYLVLPLLGPSGVRDAVGLVGDAALGFYTYFVTVPGVTIGATAVNVVNERARLLDVVQNAKDASLDYYTFVRNAYIQHRWKQINNAIGANQPYQQAGTQPEEDLYNEEIYENYLEHGDTP
jgi:phospholipid-binding lipoprotein MlaA